LVKLSVEKAKEMLTEVLQAALEEGALKSLGVTKKGEHKKDRIGYFNSGYRRTIDTIIGAIKFKRIRVVFKHKSKKFESKIIKKYSRRDSELIYLTLIGYFTGQSCRKMAVLLQKMYGTILSPTGVSRVLKVIDKKRDEFHKRRIDKYYRFIWLDGNVCKSSKYWEILGFIGLRRR
jgi:transposase-like protein